MFLSNSPSRFNSQPLTESIILQNQSRFDMRRHQVNEQRHYHRMALQNFPFGKQGIKISQYVSNQLNSKQQEQNARILESFRRKAIQDKFHNKYGHLNNNRLMQRYITQNMLPGVTVNPSIVGDLGTELKNNSVVYDSPIRKISDFTQHYTQPTYISTLQNNGNLYNARRKTQMPSPYHSIISYSPMNPQKITINSECQTSQNSPEIKRFKEVDLQRKYYKLKHKSSKKELKKFDKLQRMLQSLNQQIRENSKYIEDVITTDKRKLFSRKRGKTYTLRHEVQDEYEQKQYVQHPRTRIKTEEKKDNQQLKNWKLNNQILYNSSTQSSFFDESSKKNPGKPKVHYTSKPQRNLQKMQNFVKPISSKKPVKSSTYESTRDYKMKQQKTNDYDTSGMQKIRNHLKLLKRNTDRLQTINSYSLLE